MVIISQSFVFSIWASKIKMIVHSFCNLFYVNNLLIQQLKYGYDI